MQKKRKEKKKLIESESHMIWLSPHFFYLIITTINECYITVIFEKYSDVKKPKCQKIVFKLILY